MASRDVPYPAFNFIVNIGTGEAFGGFSDVSGLQTEITVSEYRNGNEKLNHARKIQNIYKTGDVTCKRGIVKSNDMWSWIQDARTKGPGAKRQVSIVLRDEAGQAVQTWNLRNVIPLKYTGPTLAGKGGGDVAMEELVLSAESLDLAV
jgi:phage tail-like protein